MLTSIQGGYSIHNSTHIQTTGERREVARKGDKLLFVKSRSFGHCQRKGEVLGRGKKGEKPKTSRI